MVASKDDNPPLGVRDNGLEPWSDRPEFAANSELLSKALEMMVLSRVVALHVVLRTRGPLAVKAVPVEMRYSGDGPMLALSLAGGRPSPSSSNAMLSYPGSGLQNKGFAQLPEPWLQDDKYRIALSMQRGNAGFSNRPGENGLTWTLATIPRGVVEQELSATVCCLLPWLHSSNYPGLYPSA